MREYPGTWTSVIRHRPEWDWGAKGHRLYWCWKRRVFDYLSFAIGCCCCCCRSDPVGNTDDSTQNLTEFPMTMNSYSLSYKDCAEHWIALTCDPSTIDFVLGKVEGRMKCLFLVNEQLCVLFIVKKQRNKWIRICTSRERHEVDRIDLSSQDLL